MRRRRVLWNNLILLFVANTGLYHLLNYLGVKNSGANKWLALAAAVGIVVMCVVTLFFPPSDGVVIFETNDPDALIPKGTQLRSDDPSIQFVTVRSVGIRWYTRLWCWLRSKPLPTTFRVPVKRVDN